MDVADVGEYDGFCRVGIDLYVVMAAFGEQGKVELTRSSSFIIILLPWLEYQYEKSDPLTTLRRF